MKYFVVNAVLVVLIISPFLWQVPILLKVGAPHYGRVIDHDTGKGIAGVTIVAMRQIEGGGWSGARGGCTFVAMTGTDENGDFHIAQTYANTFFTFPGNNPQQYWDLYLGKDGYFQFVDKSPLTIDKVVRFSHALVPGHFGGNESSWRGLQVEFAPIQMVQAQMEFEDRVATFNWRGSRQALGFCRVPPDVRPLLQNQVDAFYAEQEQYVCDAPSISTTDARTVLTLTLLAPKAVAFLNARKAIAPDFREGREFGADRFPMGDLCKIMRAGNGKP